MHDCCLMLVIFWANLSSNSQCSYLKASEYEMGRWLKAILIVFYCIVHLKCDICACHCPLFLMLPSSSNDKCEAYENEKRWTRNSAPYKQRNGSISDCEYTERWFIFIINYLRKNWQRTEYKSMGKLRRLKLVEVMIIVDDQKWILLMTSAKGKCDVSENYAIKWHLTRECDMTPRGMKWKASQQTPSHPLFYLETVY